jgi:hypothetical protein
MRHFLPSPCISEWNCHEAKALVRLNTVSGNWGLEYKSAVAAAALHVMMKGIRPDLLFMHSCIRRIYYTMYPRFLRKPYAPKIFS